MKKLTVMWMLLLSPFGFVQASITCSGVIREINNYNNNENLYVLFNTTSHYVYLETKAAVAMALAAFAAGKTIDFYMSESSITACSGGLANGSWDNGTRVSGWFHVRE